MQETWGSASDDATVARVGQPVGFLLGGAGACVASIAVLVFGDALLPALPRHVLGWFLASMVGFSFVAMYRRETERRRHMEPAFESNPFYDLAATGVLILGIGLAGLNAWLLATDLAS